MRLEFHFALNRHVAFEMSIEYEADDLQFSPKIQSTQNNIAHILQRYAAIDRIHQVTLKGLTPLRFRYIEHWRNILLCENLLISSWTPEKWDKLEKNIEFNLDAVIYLYKSGAIVRWKPDRELPFWICQMLDGHYDAIKPVLVGTVIYYLPELKAEAKAVVKSNAIRRAKIMQSNAEDILLFLGEVI